jgi:surfeit locus 1 family protein
MRRIIFPLLLGLVGCAILVGLGTWQMQRMEWKRAILDEITAKIIAPPVALLAAPVSPDEKYLPVFAEGQFTGDFIEVLSGQKGGTPGVRIIEAFATKDGRRILVDRGFLEDTARATPRTGGATRVEGNLHWPKDADSFTPPPDPKSGMWFARDVEAMAAKLNTEPTFIVARAPTGDAITPMPVDTSSIPNDHWGYAITWFLLAATWAGMTGLLVWRIRQRTV